MYRQRFPDDPGQHNVEDTYSRTTYRDNPSFCDRVRSSLVAVVVGVGLLTAASGLIFWNEGRAVQTAKSLQEGLDLVITLQTSEVAFEQNNGKLVYLSGPLKTSKALHDAEYDVTLSAVKLRRKVEMYQWVEEEHTRTINEGERTRTETTYSYAQFWRQGVVKSSQFANPSFHHNPTEVAVKPTTYTAEGASIGSFLLSEGMVNRIDNFRQLKLTEAPSGDSQLHEGMVYHGKDPRSPQVGDIRVTFEFAGLSGSENPDLGPAEIVSIIGRQDGNQLSAYQTDAGDKLDLIYMGDLSAQKMIGKEQAQNSILCWGLRFGGWLLMFIGFGCITRIIVTLVDWVPIVRDIVNLGVMTLNATLSISLSLTIIALGWIWYRPWLGAFILCLATLPFILSRRRAVAATNRQSYYPPTTHRYL